MLRRIKSIDFLRGLTVFSMVIYHFFIYWIKEKQNFGLFAEIFHFFGYLAAPLFLIISEISLHLFFIKKKNEGMLKSKIFFDVLKRSIFIFIVSTVFQIFFGFTLGMKIEFFIYWSVFQVICFSMVFFFAIQFCKKSLRILLHLILMIFLILFEFIIKSYNLTVLYILVEGTFEFVPWASFFLFGLIFGEFLLSFTNEMINRKLISLIIIGIVCFIFTIFWMNYFDFYYYVPYFFPNFIMMLGIFCILSSISYYVLDGKKNHFFLLESINRWGKLAFSVYYIHLGVIAVGIFLFPIFLNEIYTKGFFLYQFIIILIVFFIALEIFMRYWQKFNYILGIEWIMNKFMKKTLFLKKDQADQFEKSI